MGSRDPTFPHPLRSIASMRTLAVGQTLFRASTNATHVFFLQSGSVRLVRFGRNGEEIAIHQAHPGEFFAEASLDSDRYHCTAIAVRPSTVLALPSAALGRLLDADGPFARQWTQTLARQLRASRTRVERLCLKTARDRVRHLLLTEGTGPEGRFALQGTVKDLASYLGLSHEVLYRTLAAMRRSGELASDGRTLRIIRR